MARGSFGVIKIGAPIGNPKQKQFPFLIVLSGNLAEEGQNLVPLVKNLQSLHILLKLLLQSTIEVSSTIDISQLK